MSEYKFIQSKNYTKGRNMPITLVVLHSMECPDKPKMAIAVANWFAGPTSPVASAHYCVDDVDIIQCVKDTDTAWHAPGANSDGIGIEMSGYAAQTQPQWEDAYSLAVIKNAAKLTAELCTTYGLPVQFVDQDGLKVNNSGITTHWEVTKAFKKCDHTDPGPNFPMNDFIGFVNEAVTAAANANTLPSPAPDFVIPMPSPQLNVVVTDDNSGDDQI